MNIGVDHIRVQIEHLRLAIVNGDQDASVDTVRALLEAGAQKEVIVSECIEAAMNSLDDKCTAENFNLLEIMLSGRAVMSVMKVLFPEQRQPLSHPKATVVLAGLQGDVHDLGKNILKIILTAKGYQVVDCGKDCPLEEIISAAVHHDADIIGLSGLISSVVPQVQEAREKLVSRGLAHIHVIAGGSALMQLAAKTLNVEFVGKTAFDGARYIAETCCAGSD